MPPLLIKHRINTLQSLSETPLEYGVELDLRDKNSRIIIHHEPFSEGEDFEEYLQHYHHSFIILNVKCEGLETRLISLMEDNNIHDYFFLDLSIPFLVKTIKSGCSKVAVRFSEYEPLEFVQKFESKAEWVWVDCFSINVLTQETYQYLKAHFKICIVSPELQGHPIEWIADFKHSFRNFELDAICTKHPDLWK